MNFFEYNLRFKKNINFFIRLSAILPKKISVSNAEYF